MVAHRKREKMEAAKDAEDEEDDAVAVDEEDEEKRRQYAGADAVRTELCARSGDFLDVLTTEFFRTTDGQASGDGPIVHSHELEDHKMMDTVLQHYPHDLVGFKRFRRKVGGEAAGPESGHRADLAALLGTTTDDLAEEPALSLTSTPGSATSSGDELGTLKMPSSESAASVRSRKRREKKKLTRVKHLHAMPAHVWANWMVRTPVFSQVVLAAIIVNAFILGLETLLDEEEQWDTLQALDLIDQITVVIFCFEILVKWVDNFRTFWLDPWNVFDFAVTVLSAVPNMILLIDPSGDVGIAAQFRVFRTLRLLKMVAKVRNLRVIIHTIMDAFQSMAFILLLLLVMTYIFAIFAISLFQDYTDDPDPDLQFQSKFKDLPNSFVSLFQLLTLDQWFFIEGDIRKVVAPYFTITFFIIYVWLGAFIFRNVFVGVMVKNFQEISKDFNRRAAAARRRKRLRKMYAELDKVVHSGSTDAFGAGSDAIRQDHHTNQADGGDFWNSPQAAESLRIEEWVTVMRENVPALKTKSGAAMYWPRDCLFEYCVVMYSILENMEEAERLQHLAAFSAMQLHEQIQALSSHSEEAGDAVPLRQRSWASMPRSATRESVNE